MASFKTLVTSLLNRAQIQNKKIRNLEKYLDAEAMDVFRQAFVHKSVSAVNNYELFEFIGDTIVNAAVADYLRRWDRNIVSVKYLTRLKHNITSKKQLALIAEKTGFWPHIVIDKETRKKFDDLPLEVRRKDLEYLSLLEDTFEAFLGAVKEVVESRTKDADVGIGLSMIVCYGIIHSFLRELDISVKYEDIFDAKTRFKELCDKRRWKFPQEVMNTKKIKAEPDFFEVAITIYPYGDKKVEPKHAFRCPIFRSNDRNEAEMTASEEALRILKEKFNIADTPPNPYELNKN